MAGWLVGPQIWLAGPQAWLAGPQAWLDGPEGGGQTDVRTDGKSPHSTGLRPLSGPLPKKRKKERKKEKGKRGEGRVRMSLGTHDRIVPVAHSFSFHHPNHYRRCLSCLLSLCPGKRSKMKPGPM